MQIFSTHKSQRLMQVILLCSLCLFLSHFAGVATAAKQTSTKQPLQGIRIGLDPGHQAKGNTKKEAVAPNASTMKNKVSSGTKGKYSNTNEHSVNLDVALLLRDKLEAAGAEVWMTRTTADVDISNSERAKIMNKAKVDLALRLHCDGNDDSSIHGASVLVPTGKYTKPIEKESAAAAKHIIEAFANGTGAKNRGVHKRDDQTGFNWSTVPVCTIEMGFMSNKKEDLLLSSTEYQKKCAENLYKGILSYFSAQ